MTKGAPLVLATAVALAPVPHASVKPAPRSHVRSVIPSSPTLATLTLIRSGKAGSCSIAGPWLFRSTACAASTKKTRCGLPTDNAIGCSSGPHAIGRCAVSIG